MGRMILICPACAKKYLVPDNAVGREGRQVRCASCRHSWFQEGASAASRPDTPAVAEPIFPPPLPSSTAYVAPSPAVERASEPPPQFVSPPMPAFVAPPATAEPAYGENQHWDYEEEPFPRRINRTRRWTIAACLVSLLLISGIAATYYLADPGFLARVGVPLGTAESPLVTQILSTDRGPKAGMSGPAYLSIHAQVINPTGQQQRVPDMLVELLDAHQRVIYSWTIMPDHRTIGPKGTETIDSTEAGIPPNADQIRLNLLHVSTP